MQGLKWSIKDTVIGQDANRLSFGGEDDSPSHVLLSSELAAGGCVASVVERLDFATVEASEFDFSTDFVRLAFAVADFVSNLWLSSSEGDGG